jgi:acyl-CoA synthetase (AMP-forming)/AMP-acid ligase II
MKRRQKNKVVFISLLPFLSILACLIGSLSLMITGISFGQMEETQAPEDVTENQKQNKEYDQIRTDIVVLRNQIKQIQSKIKAVNDEENNLAEVKISYNELTSKLEEAKANTTNGLRRIGLLNEERRQNRVNIEQLKQENANSEKLIISHKSDLAFRKDPVNHPRTIVKTITDGSIKTPFFMECKNDQLLFIEKGKLKSTFKMPLISNKEFHSFLTRVNKVNGGGVIFLVRTSGSEVYKKAKRLAIHFSCKNGKIPVQGIGMIDTSNFKATLPETIKIITPSKKSFKDIIRENKLKYKKTPKPKILVPVPAKGPKSKTVPENPSNKTPPVKTK